MGFWHTGYMEFHEEVGLAGYEFRTKRREFPCAACGQVFETADELQTHRLEAHPLHRPALIVHGAVAGSRRVFITSKIKPTDVLVERCDRVLVNGRATEVERLGEDLAARSWGNYRLILSGDEVEAEHTVEFRIASDQDLAGVEEEFSRIARTKRLDMRIVENLIGATRRFETARSYSDAICTYLHGVLAKERSAGCPLPYEKYNAKYTEISGTASPHALASSAISTPTPPETMPIATRSLAGGIPMTQLRTTSKNSSVHSAH